MDGAHKRRMWRCRRGAKELDVLLSEFAAAHAGALDAAAQKQFDRLLDCADPQLQDWLCNGARPRDAGIDSIVRRILSSRPA